jgi:hypothetical protein
VTLLRLFLSCSVLVLSACSHNGSVENLLREPILAKIENACADQSCELGPCWWVKDLQSLGGKKIFCDVNFTFTSLKRQEELLNLFSKELSTDSLAVGLCGRNSIGTQFVQTLLFVPATVASKSSFFAASATQGTTNAGTSKEICANTTYFHGNRK